VTETVINTKTLAAAAQSGRDLWKEARECQYQVITLLPKSLRSDEFKVLQQDSWFCACWGVVVVDEAHLVDDWGCNFHKSFADIWTLRLFAPDHITFVALSDSVELGCQTEQVLRSLEFCKGHYYFDKRNCECHNIDLIFHDIKYTCTGRVFRDIDWLIPVDLIQASDFSKWLLISDTIEVGHQIMLYLCTLLPLHLRRFTHVIIQHMHSMNCPDCKQEGMAALCEMGDARQTAIFIAMAVLEVGVDIPELPCMVLFPQPQSSRSLVQRAG
jgi:hypothetical protein